MTVEVFKTDVSGSLQSKRLVALLLSYFPKYEIHFDLEDCDKVLRIEAPVINPTEVKELMKNQGFYCEELE